MNPIPIEHGQEVLFPEGLAGCGDWRRFTLDLSPELMPLALLRSLDVPGLSLIVADPRLWHPRYECDVSPADLEFLGAAWAEDLTVFIILSGSPEPFAVTANLLGPLVVHPATRRGRQIVQSGRPYSAQQPLTPAADWLAFADGLVGCPEWKQFTLHRLEELDPIALLVSQDVPALCLPVVDPWVVEPAYAPELGEADRLALGLTSDDEPQWLAVLTVPDEASAVTANLLGPLVVNRRTGAARQVILAQSGYSAAHPAASMSSTLGEVARVSA